MSEQWKPEHRVFIHGGVPFYHHQMTISEYTEYRKEHSGRIVVNTSVREAMPQIAIGLCSVYGAMIKQPCITISTNSDVHILQAMDYYHTASLLHMTAEGKAWALTIADEFMEAIKDCE